MIAPDRARAVLPHAEQRQAAAAKKLVQAAGGGEAASAQTGKSEAQLSRYGRSNYADNMPASVIEALESVSHGTHGHPVMSRYLAQQQGYTLIRLPDAHASGADMLRLVARQAKESGDITSAMITALEDNHLSPAQITALRREVAELIEVAVAMDAELAFFEQDRA